MLCNNIRAVVRLYLQLPKYRDLRAVPLQHAQELFPEGSVSFGCMTLAPPVSRRVCKLGPMLYNVFDAFPFLRTHVFCLIRKAIYAHTHVSAYWSLYPIKSMEISLDELNLESYSHIFYCQGSVTRGAKVIATIFAIAYHDNVVAPRDGTPITLARS